MSLQDRKTDCAKKDEDQFVHFLTGIGIREAVQQFANDLIDLGIAVFEDLRDVINYYLG